MKRRAVTGVLLVALAVSLCVLYLMWTTHHQGPNIPADGPVEELVKQEAHDQSIANSRLFSANKPAVDIKALLFEKVRVLCWVMTSPDNLNTKAIHVKKTWGQRCNKLIFISSKDDAEFPAIGIKTDEGREHLTAKTMHAFKYIYDHHMNDADWFMKADDDTYVIVENLRLMLADKSPEDPVYFGHHFHVIVQPQGYHSGGAGYVLSKEAVRRYGLLGHHNHTICQEDDGAEDVAIGMCMQNLGVKVGESYDKQGRSRFHCFNVATHMHRNYPDWYLQYDSHGSKSGIDSISDYAISFHYVDPNEMWNMEFYTHRLRTFGSTDSQNMPELHQYYLKAAL